MRIVKEREIEMIGSIEEKKRKKQRDNNVRNEVFCL